MNPGAPLDSKEKLERVTVSGLSVVIAKLMVMGVMVPMFSVAIVKAEEVLDFPN